MPTLSLALNKAVVSRGIQTDQRLIHVKSILEQNGIADLATQGTLLIGNDPQKKNFVPTPGILTPSQKPGDMIGRARTLTRVHLAETTSLSNNVVPSSILVHNGFLAAHELKGRKFASPVSRFGTTFNVPDAYWVADTIEISDNTIVVLTNVSADLFIIANRITLGKGVQFTWQRPVQKSPVQHRRLKQPAQNKVPDSEDKVIHGEDQLDGRRGAAGMAGADAPSVEIWTLDMMGRPVVDLEGQAGQDGQDGQDGSKGQNGANGISGKVYQSPVGGWTCDRYAGSGGNGARGGNGGDGGNGGTGGNGGRFTIFAPGPKLTQLAAHGFYCAVQGGKGGNGGQEGRGGEGGEGGTIGKTDRSRSNLLNVDVCVCGPKRGAENGKDGPRGQDGKKGRNGNEGTFSDSSIRLLEITEADFVKQLTKPAIQSINKAPAIASAGESLTINGLNFANTDEVLFNQQIVPPGPGVRTNALVSVTVPVTDGGNVRLTIRRNDGTLSNPFTIVIAPKITAVAQVGMNGNRFKPGREITITGSGFSSDSIVFANNLQLEQVKFIGNSELRAMLVRPFGADEFPDATGEPVAITVKIPGTRAGTVESAPHDIKLDTFRMLVLGDSIQWGQGLQNHQKIHQLVEDEFRRRLGNVGVYKSVVAHSGAIIGNGNELQKPQIGGEFGGEINDSFPTVRQQVQLALKGAPTDDTIDLVLMDGGINDVGIENILKEADQLKIDALTRECCHNRMVQLLNDTAQAFPKAKIVVTGYFRIFSGDSDESMIRFGLMGLGVLVAGFPGVVGGLALSAVLIDAIRDRCKRFHENANDQILAATKGNAENARIAFVDPAFGDGNAMFAPNAFLFGINVDLTPQDNDVVAKGRASACAALRGRGNPMTCPIASIGHPTPDGARRYAERVFEAILAAFPELLA